MSQIQLKLHRYRTHTIGTHVLHLEQIIIWMRIFKRQRPHLLREGVLDTGSPITVFPEKEWRQFDTEISWITAPNDPNVPPWCRQFGGAAGGRIPCRIGLVSIEFFDHLGGRTGPTDLVAMFARDNGVMRDILIGLGGGPFTKRRFDFTYDVPTISLTDI